MRWLRIGLASLAAAGVAAGASYAWAAPPEAYLGQVVGKGAGARPSAARAAPALRLGDVARSQGAVGAFARALDQLEPEARTATRGANETRIYQQAAASVVLIVTDDGLGSGVLISADGQIVTNLHVVEGADEVGVIFKPLQEGAEASSADVHRAKVLRRDEVADLALIQVSELPGHVKPLSLAPGGTSVSVGANVHAIGHPTGRAWTYTRGFVSQIRRDYAWSTEDRLKHQATVIQTQTPINPGNSGGPLIDDNLQVVGINSFKGEGEGLNFAVSAEDVRAFLGRTSDRAAAKAPDPKTCKVAVVGERASKDPVGTEFLMDADCDGQGDYIAIYPKDKREPVTLLMDDNGDGKIDTVLFDKGGDGQLDYALYDTDGDGEFDLEGKYRKGEDEPYKYEKIRQ